jgi:GT2 family glycosyltransferase
MNKPTITFLSPCYNHGKYVIESLESVKNQTYNNVFHVIIDDGSTDDSVEKIQAWIEKNSYDCLFIRHTVNQGICRTLNEGIRLAKGTYWTALATDDIAKPERSQRFVDFLNQHPDCLMVTSDCELINEQGQKDFFSGTNSFLEYYSSYEKHALKYFEYGSYRSLLEGNYIPGSLMIRTSAFKQLGGFDESLKLDDWEMWLRISSVSPIALIDGKLTQYRFHEQNSIKTMDFTSDELKIFIRQRKICYMNNFKEDYLKIYYEKLKHNFVYDLNNAATRLFLRETPLLVFKMLGSKLFNGLVKARA